MPGMEFEYDEKGGTFYYFLLSFLAFILVPLTYYLWPRKEKESLDENGCCCRGCYAKANQLKATESKYKDKIIVLLLIVGWCIFAVVAYKASQVQIDYTEFDPYFELGIDREATTKEIKRAYRQLSMLHHPDKGGDPLKFMKITKAHLALTDEEAKENWKNHGNPDGPGATHFGIALPKWIVEKRNSVWVLAVYGLVFMIILPVVVGTWWYRSIKYSADHILMDTTQLYYYLFNKSPNMIVKRVIMILGASFEFEKSHNGEIVERASDNFEVPSVIKDMSLHKENVKEKPLCYPYSVKARTLIHAHLSRYDLPPKTLEKDRQYILKKCSYLINEMVTIVAQLVALGHAGKVAQCPRLDTLESVMKLSQMLVQARWDTNLSPLIQLPHLTVYVLKQILHKKGMKDTIQDFARIKNETRRRFLSMLSDAEYKNMMTVLSSMPYVTMELSKKVLDDEDDTITAGAIVTVTVSLKRENMSVLFPPDSPTEKIDNSQAKAKQKKQEKAAKKEKVPDEKTDSPVTKVDDPTPMVFTKRGRGTKASKQKQKAKRKDRVEDIKLENEGDEKKKDKAEENDSDCEDEPKKVDTLGGDLENDEDLTEDDQKESQANDEVEDDDDDDAWMKFQEESKKENILETKSKQTYLVHCPNYPAVKHEWWWVYVCDKKKHDLITIPAQVCSLKTTEEVQLKFSAPSKPGKYTYTVCLKSDSYFAFDQQQAFTMDVKEAKKMDDHPQWNISDDEDEDDDKSGDDDDCSDSDDSSDYDVSD